jgi:hypothetical protein
MRFFISLMALSSVLYGCSLLRQPPVPSARVIKGRSSQCPFEIRKSVDRSRDLSLCTASRLAEKSPWAVNGFQLVQERDGERQVLLFVPEGDRSFDVYEEDGELVLDEYIFVPKPEQENKAGGWNKFMRLRVDCHSENGTCRLEPIQCLLPELKRPFPSAMKTIWKIHRCRYGRDGKEFHPGCKGSTEAGLPWKIFFQALSGDKKAQEFMDHLSEYFVREGSAFRSVVRSTYAFERAKEAGCLKNHLDSSKQ